MSKHINVVHINCIPLSVYQLYLNSTVKIIKNKWEKVSAMPR